MTGKEQRDCRDWHLAWWIALLLLLGVTLSGFIGVWRSSGKVYDEQTAKQCRIAARMGLPLWEDCLDG